MESEHFPIKVSEDIIRVYQNGPEHSDLEHGQNHYIKGHFFQLSTNFFHGHSLSNALVVTPSPRFAHTKLSAINSPLQA